MPAAIQALGLPMVLFLIRDKEKVAVPNSRTAKTLMETYEKSLATKNTRMKEPAR
jgi:hypothetical protein